HPKAFFWTAWLLNQIFSCEYGRTPLHVDIGCTEPVKVEHNHMKRSITLAKAAPRLRVS
ncbi:hypothetical protein BDV97DRAFT_297083, partial [Delphinella strobiligena]